jgi:hypothetical protein
VGERADRAPAHDAAAVAGLLAGTRYAPFSSRPRGPAAGDGRGARRQDADQKLSATEKHLLELEERLVLLDGYFRGEAIRVLPAADRQAAGARRCCVTRPDSSRSGARPRRRA